MPREELVSPTPALIEELASTMRPEDVAECWAFGVTPIEAVQSSVKGSRDPKVWLVDGEVGAMFGVSSWTLLTTIGHPWLLSAPPLLKSQKRFLRFSKYYTQDIRDEWQVLFNYVDARYETAVNWIRFMGYTVYPAEPFGPRNMLMHKFEMVR